jgi:hypothetical protein
MSKSMTGCNTHVLTDKFDLRNVNDMVFYISGPKDINDCEKYTTEAFYLLIYLSEINFH